MKKRIVISQPAMGRYRKGFIDEIIKLNNDEFELFVYASEVANTGAKSMESLPPEINYNLVKHSSILERFFWQSLVFKILKLKLNKNDKFVFCGNPRYLSNMVLAFWLKLSGVDVIWWGHGWSSTSSRLGSYIRFKLMNLFRVILYTENEVQLLKNKIKSPMCGLNNGLNVNEIRNGYKLNTCKYDENILQIAFLGRITSKSDFDLLINALLVMPSEKSQKIRLNVIGDVTETEITNISDKAKQLNIELHGEIWDEKEITNILGKCHVFVYPGAVGLSLIHAFALGLPAIIHNERTAHMPEIAAFEEEVSGISFDMGSKESLAKSLIWASDNKSILASYAVSAFDTVTNTFNTSDMAKRFMNFVQSK
jgi:glycosyltransferase involved in cell wall biosynthesis